MGRPEERKKAKKRAPSACKKIVMFAAKRQKTEESENRFSVDRENTIVASESANSGSACLNLQLSPKTTPLRETSFCFNLLEGQSCQSSRSPVDMNDEHEPSVAPTIAADPCHDSGVVLNNITGSIIGSCDSDSNAIVTLKSMPTARKYALLKEHSAPPESYAFLTTFLGRCKRSFRRNWLVEHKWLAYSMQLDGGFCVACAIFNGVDGLQIKQKFVTKPFKIMWYKKSKQCKEHETLKYQDTAMQLANDLIHEVKSPKTGVLMLADKQRAANVEKNRKLLKHVIRAVLFCATVYRSTWRLRELGHSW